jgi:triacylglycerol esterase/lipase EstA (alpha/beta hydrolase family)
MAPVLVGHSMGGLAIRAWRAHVGPGLLAFIAPSPSVRRIAAPGSRATPERSTA